MADPALSFEHKVLRTLKGVQPPRPSRWLLAVSGGVDSLVLTEVLWRWRRQLKIELAVGHIHHGSTPDKNQNLFRQKASQLVESWCVDHGVRLNSAKVSARRSSEASLREARLRVLREWFLIGQFDRVVFAHHADDLLETRLLRLLRGSGRQGLKAMAVERGRVLRPLLNLSRHEIEHYARLRNLQWLEDPSNSSPSHSLRNWLRHEWLPQLEKRSPGAKMNMARSLENLAEEDFTETIGPFVGLRRTALASVSSARRESLVARYLRTMGLSGYSRHHVQELLKRIEDQNANARWEMLGFQFHATPDFLWAAPATSRV